MTLMTWIRLGMKATMTTSLSNCESFVPSTAALRKRCVRFGVDSLCEYGMVQSVGPWV